MKHYAVDDFIGGAYVGATETKKDFVNKKISLLHDFCILHDDDYREPLVETVLNQCNTEHEMTTVLHDVLVGRTTLNARLTQKGVM